MYHDDYEKNRQEQSDGTQGYPADHVNGSAGQAESEERARQEFDENAAVNGSQMQNAAGADSQGQTVSGNNYSGSYNSNSGQSASGSNYSGSYNSGSGQNASGGNYGSGYQNGAGQPGAGNSYGGGYGTAQPGMNHGYGSSQPNQNRGYGSQQPHQHYAPWQQPQQFQQQPRKKKPHPILRKAAGITAAALLFGVVAGGTLSGVNLAVSRLAANSYGTEETQTTLAQAETVPAPTQPSGGSTAVNAIPAITNDVSAIVEKAMPSVVAINSVTEYQTQNWFGQPQVYQGKGSGSGIIVGESDTELLIVTNNHVVEGAKSIAVVFTDNESVEANIKGTDSENDLAVVAVALDKIADSTKSKIAVATLGDSDSLKVGQGVIAIGNALGYGQSVTVGYVSALDREVQTDEQTTRNLLQTDAAINPGNSGGALLNMQGEVIGINSAKYSSTEVEGMGYAIPISKVHDIIDDLMTKKTRVQIEEAKQGYLGIQGTDIDSNASTLYGMPQGVYVYKIMDDGAAASSDLKEKDIITKFDGQTVKSMSELKNMLTYYAGGDTVEITVQSLVDGQYVERQVELTLGTRPAEESDN